MKKELTFAFLGLFVIGLSVYFTWTFFYGNPLGYIISDNEYGEYSVSLVGIDGRYSGKIFVERGAKKDVRIEFFNSGKDNLRECYLLYKDMYDFVSLDDKKENVDPGDKFFYDLSIDIPPHWNYNSLNLTLKCDGFSKEYEFPLVLSNPSILFAITNYSVSDNKIIVNYEIDDSYFGSDLVLSNYTFYGENSKVAEGDKVLDANYDSVSIDIPKGISGEFELVINVRGKDSFVTDKKKIIIVSTSLTGFAIKAEDGKTLPYLGVAVMIIFIFIFTVRFLGRHHNRSKSSHHSFNKSISRRYIKLDIN